jgi:hypothetical protein
MSSEGLFEFGFSHDRFFGISLQFQSPDEFASWHKWSDNQTVRQLNDRFRDTKELKKGSKELFLFTTQAHEVRHFHDSLISPIFIELSKLHLSATILALTSLHYVSKGRKVLPIPFTSWLDKDPNSIRELETNYRGLIIREGEMMPPAPGSPERSTIELCSKLYGRYAELLSIIDYTQKEGKVSTRDLFEYSAFQVQTEFIKKTLGHATQKRFEKNLRRLSPEYSERMQNVINRLGIEGTEENTGFIAATIHWCLNSLWEGSTLINPSSRFEMIRAYFKKYGIKSSNQSIPEMMEQWSNDLKVKSIKENITESVRMFEEMLQELISNFEFLENEYYEFFVGVKRKIQALDYMRVRYLDNVSNYVHPIQYRINIEKYVCAPIRVEFFPTRLRVKKEDDKKPFFINDSRSIPNSSDEQVLSIVLKTTTSGITIMEPFIANYFEHDIALADYLYFVNERHDKLFDLSADRLIEKGLQPFELF